GGVGKTRLALQLAADVLEQYPDGVWLVELAPLSDPALLPQAVASALGVREEPGRVLTQTLADYLKGRSLLLLLDNCEHITGSCAQPAETRLRASPQLQILATSREALGITGEVAWRVPSLALPDLRLFEAAPTGVGANGHNGPVTEYAAVRLFGERAAAV